MVRWGILISSVCLFFIPEVVFSETKNQEKCFSYYMPSIKKIKTLLKLLVNMILNTIYCLQLKEFLKIKLGKCQILI